MWISNVITGESVITKYSGYDGFLVVNKQKHPSFCTFMKSTANQRQKLPKLYIILFNSNNCYMIHN